MLLPMSTCVCTPFLPRHSVAQTALLLYYYLQGARLHVYGEFAKYSTAVGHFSHSAGSVLRAALGVCECSLRLGTSPLRHTLARAREPSSQWIELESVVAAEEVSTAVRPRDLCSYVVFSTATGFFVALVARVMSVEPDVWGVDTALV